jgi:hypothetical protein
VGDDQHVHPLGEAGLDQQRGVQHHDHVPVPRGLQPVGNPLEDRRVGDLVQQGELARVAEDDAGQRLPVDGTVGEQHLRPEVVTDLAPGARARHDHLASDAVGVDDLGAPLGEHA